VKTAASIAIITQIILIRKVWCHRYLRRIFSSQGV